MPRERDVEKARARGFYHVSLRLPVELHAQLQATSTGERRSLHAQILRYIEEGLRCDAAARAQAVATRQVSQGEEAGR